MRKSKEQFQKRVEEIEKYFDFLVKLSYEKPKIHYSLMGQSLTYSVDNELLKILKANGFLLIYNLMEAITKISLVEYLQSIKRLKLPFQKVEEVIQKLWIENQYFVDKSLSQKGSQNAFMEIYSEVVKKTIIEFTTEIKNNKGEVIKEFVKLSGNVDAQTIRELGVKYGFDTKVDTPSERASASLLEIKRRRNFLAHGRITFADCGKDFTVPDMCNYKNNVIIYLTAILNNIEEHVKAKKFKKERS